MSGNVRPKLNLDETAPSAAQRVLNAVITYHHGEAVRKWERAKATDFPGQAEDHQKIAKRSIRERVIEAINRQIEPIFFERMFVLRPEARVVLEQLDTEAFCIVHGTRGSGKSTIIQFAHNYISGRLDKSNFAHEVTGDASKSSPRDDSRPTDRPIHEAHPQDPNWYFYVDAEFYRQELKDKIRTICGLLYSQVYDRAHISLGTFDKLWRKYQQEHYPPLADAIRKIAIAEIEFQELGMGEIAPDVRATLQMEVLRAREQFEQANDTSKLDLLLSFLRTEYDIYAGFAVDNIDLFDSEVQQQVTSEMAHFAFQRKLIQNSIVGIRTENLDYLLKYRKGISGFTRRDAIDVSLDPVSTDVAIQMLRLRIAVFKEILQSPDVSKFGRTADGIHYVNPDDTAIKDSDDIIKIAESFLTIAPKRSHVSEKRLKDYFHQLLLWHNFSLRSLCGAIYDLGLCLIANSDPIYDFETIKNQSFKNQDNGPSAFGQSIGNRVRFSRGLLIRNFLATDIRKLEFDASLLVLQRPDKAVESSTLPYLRLHILKYLAERGQTNLSTMQRDLELFGSNLERIRDAIIELGEHVGADERGLIQVDGRPIYVDDRGLIGRPELKNSSTISLLPAGKWLQTRFAHMTDYVFWNAYAAHDEELVFGRRRREVTSAELADEEFRILSSLTYLEQRISARYISIFNMETLDRSGKSPRVTKEDYLDRYLHIFGSYIPPISIAKEINDFAQKGDFDTKFQDLIRKRTQKIKEAVVQPFNDVPNLSKRISL